MERCIWTNEGMEGCYKDAVKEATCTINKNYEISGHPSPFFNADLLCICMCVCVCPHARVTCISKIETPHNNRHSYRIMKYMYHFHI